MFDVFYIGKKPNILPHEQPADSIEHAIGLSRTRYCWIVNYLSDYSSWDWLWEPPPWQSHQRHAWASQWQKDSGTYLVPKQGYTDTNYHQYPVIQRLPDPDHWQWPKHEISSWDTSWHPDPTEPDMSYQFGTQHQMTGGPRYSGGSVIKYVSYPRAQKIDIDEKWDVPDGIDTEEFDWTWHPDDRDPPYIYQFGTQHQRTGGPVYTVPGATDIKYVTQITAKAQKMATMVFLLDHLDGNVDKVRSQIPDQYPVKTTRYFNNYLDTLKRLAKTSEDVEFAWILSSVCDYKDFDFSWHPEKWQQGMLHVFSSGDQKFGDTFFLHVPSFRSRCDTIQLLDWYDVNFIEDPKTIRRWPIPAILHNEDAHADIIKKTAWQGPLALFTNKEIDNATLPTVSLWREKTKTIVPLDIGGESVIIPKESVPYLKTQIYDYPYIDKSHRLLANDPLDIVFISNGEHGADHHWQCLLDNLGTPQQHRVHRVDGVKGRVASYQAAARVSRTPWFFAVFAKLLVNEDFNWTWQPDRLQQPKHYIFHAYNPVNDLVYGHQAMIAYNRRLVLENTGQGLDFTLDQPHEVVPIVSGTAYYDNDPWTCWRTAFRECIKLQNSLPDVENDYRLQQWLFVGKGINGHWSTTGADDAVKYYESVGGDFDQLKKSYEWDWLASYGLMLHPELFTESNT